MLKFPLTPPQKINNNNNNNDDKLNPSESTTTGKSSSTTTNKKINQRHLLSNINVLEVLVLVQFVDHGKFDDAEIHIPCTNCITFGCDCILPEVKKR